MTSAHELRKEIKEIDRKIRMLQTVLSLKKEALSRADAQEALRCSQARPAHAMSCPAR